MKLFIKVLCIVYIISSLHYAQNFFPLSVGNKYQFKDRWFSSTLHNNESGTVYFNYTVLKDTLIEGKIFYSIPEVTSGPFASAGLFTGAYFYQYDTLEQKIYMRIPEDDSTRLAVDFNTPLDSHYISYIRGVTKEFKSEGFSYETVFGDTHLVYKMNAMGGSPFINIDYYFADQIGIYKFYYVWSNNFNSGYESTQYLLSAIIDSQIINPLILEIDTLQPIMDRPIDTFPFLLTAEYSSSYNALIDSFYLSVEHFRSDTIVSRTRFDISIYNPTINFNISALQVGDILKLRAKITDVSIYNNVDFYPDTGWTIINVLPPVLEVEMENRIYSYKLGQNYPNPFNPATTINYQISKLSFVTIKVYDVLGNEVATLVYEELPAGSYEIQFDGANLTSGIYFYQLRAGNFVETKKMVFLR